MNDDKVSMGLRQVSVKDAWTKKNGKTKEEWEKPCVESGLLP
jgi:hypothetical protein